MPITPMEYAQSKAIVSILKKRFPNLSVDETLALAFDILTALETVREQMGAKHE